MLISAGFDAHERDPLARMRLSTSGLCGTDEGRFATPPTGIVTAASSRSPKGGYDLAALKACLESHHRCARRSGRAPAGRAASRRRHRARAWPSPPCAPRSRKYWKL